MDVIVGWNSITNGNCYLLIPYRFAPPVGCAAQPCVVVCQRDWFHGRGCVTSYSLSETGSPALC